MNPNSLYDLHNAADEGAARVYGPGCTVRSGADYDHSTRRSLTFAKVVNGEGHIVHDAVCVYALPSAKDAMREIVARLRRLPAKPMLPCLKALEARVTKVGMTLWSIDAGDRRLALIDRHDDAYHVTQYLADGGVVEFTPATTDTFDYAVSAALMPYLAATGEAS